MKWSVVLGQFLGSKAIVDKVKLPAKYYNKVDNSLQELESWSNTFKGLEVDKPQTWVDTSLQVMRRISEPEQEIEKPKQSVVHRFMDKIGYVRLDNLNAIQFYNEFIPDHFEDAEKVLEGDNGIVYRLEIPDCEDDFYFYELSGDQGNDIDMDMIPFLPDFQEEKERRVKIDKALAEWFWEDKDICKLDVKNDITQYASFQPPEREYEGELTRLGDDLGVFVNKGIRRSILFQGPPGTGKSTLTFNLAKELTGRAVVLTHDFLTWVNDTQWEYALSLLQPEMLIVDDVDRIADHLERKLYMFEDHYCDVPLILMTSNHYDWLPKAFQRPGRIDEIIEMQTPSMKVRCEVIRSIAAQEGVRVPPEKMVVLDEIHQDYPGAYIVELFRRVKAHGWDYQIPDYDLTFKKLDDQTRKRWNGDIPVENVPDEVYETEDIDPMDIDVEDLEEEEEGSIL